MAPPPRSSMPLHFPRQGLSANHSDATQCTLSETIPKRKRRKKQNEKGVESADTVELNSRVRSSSRGDGVDQWLRCAAHYSEPAAAGSIPDGSSSSRLAPPQGGEEGDRNRSDGTGELRYPAKSILTSCIWTEQVYPPEGVDQAVLDRLTAISFFFFFFRY